MSPVDSHGAAGPSPQPLETILEARDLRKRFGGSVVLDGVGLEIQTGEFFTLLGPSGCGKTTLLRIIAGLDTPDSGRLLIQGRDALPLPAQARPVNTVFQSYALFPHLTVWENVAFGLRVKKTGEAELKQRVNQALEWVQASELASRMPAQLSGGQKQRIALARAIVNQPKILLLDEPLAALDLKLRHQLQEELRRLQRQLGMTFIYVTHDQDEAFSLSDRVAILHQGRLEQVGTPQELYGRPRNRFVAQFLGGCNLFQAQRAGAQWSTEFGALPAVGVAATTKENRPVWLGIRPEHISAEIAGPAAPLDGALPATLREVRFFGAELRCVAQVKDHTLRVHLPSSSPIASAAPGARLLIRVSGEHLHPLED